MIFLIISVAAIIMFAEIFYYAIVRKEGLHEDGFIFAKTMSLAVGFVIYLFTIGVPKIYCTPIGLPDEKVTSCTQTFGLYWGTIGLILIYFTSNWYITKYLDKKDREKTDGERKSK